MKDYGSPVRVTMADEPKINPLMPVERMSQPRNSLEWRHNLVGCDDIISSDATGNAGHSSDVEMDKATTR
jgi:hypothetical protein